MLNNKFYVFKIIIFLIFVYFKIKKINKKIKLIFLCVTVILFYKERN